MEKTPHRLNERFKHRHLILLVLLATLLSSCGNDEADAMFANYQQRLATSLDMPPPERTAPENIAAFPNQEKRLFELPEMREGLRNVYALRECGITNLIARHNNSLGKVAPPSQQWLYELALWRRLESCWQSDIPEQLSEEDRKRLERLLVMKTRQLPKASWNALFGSSEWVSNFSRASSPLPPGKAIELDRPLAAIAYLRKATRKQFDLDWQAESSVLENHLQALGREPLSAALLRSLLLASQRLDEINNLLERAWRAGKTCSDASAWPSLSKHQAMTYLKTLDQAGSRWLAAIEKLLEAHSVTRSAVSRYRQEWLSLDNPTAPWQQFQAQRKRFETNWRRTGERCARPES